MQNSKTKTLDRQSFLIAIPSLCHLEQHHCRERLALLNEVAGFIAQSGDGGFAVYLWNELQKLADVSACIKCVGEVHLLFSDRVEHGFRQGVWRTGVMNVLHSNPDLLALIQNSNAPGAA